MTAPFSRRTLMRRAAHAGICLALPQVAQARNAPKRQERLPANDRIALAIIGTGGMGGAHIDRLMKRGDVDIVAVCDVFEPNRDKAKSKAGSQCAAYNDYRYILDRKGVDAVLVATPDHWHALIAKNAAEAGKDIYCEKPLTHSIGEGRPLIDAVRRYGRVFQTGSQQRSEANFRFACELVRSGKIGKIHTVHTGFGGAPEGGDPRIVPLPKGLDWEMYLGPAPKVPFQKERYGFAFRWFYDYGGGMLTDWGAHHNDIAQWGLGMDESGPVEVEGFGVFPKKGIYETPTAFEVAYSYANGVRLRCSNLDRGVRFVGTEGWIHVDRGWLDASSPDILRIQLTPNDTHLYASPGHYDDWFQCIRTRQRPLCDVETAFRSATVCHMGNIALRLRRKLRWDPVAERFLGDEEANRWLMRPYRAPWRL